MRRYDHQRENALISYFKFSPPINFLKERYGEQPRRFASVSSIGSGIISHENDRSALGMI